MKRGNREGREFEINYIAAAEKRERIKVSLLL